MAWSMRARFLSALKPFRRILKRTQAKARMTNRFPRGHLAALIIWLLIFGAVYLFFDAQQKSKIKIATRPDKGSGEVVIPRSRDGHYYVAGSVNGHPLTFLVDTGASTVSITRAFARQAGLPPGNATEFHTASGSFTGETISGVEVEIAGIQVSGISVGVGVQMADQKIGLLGQNFLRRVELIQSGDAMIIRMKK